LIEQAKQAGRSIVKNGQGSGSKLPESDREDMEIFLTKIHQLMPALGADFLVPPASASAVTTPQDILYCEIKGHKATGSLSSNGFVVFKGSHASLEDRNPSEEGGKRALPGYHPSSPRGCLVPASVGWRVHHRRISAAQHLHA